MKSILTSYDVVAIVNLLGGEFNGSQTPNNIALLTEVAKELPHDAVCLEIGTRGGFSAISFLLGNLNLHLTSIDNDGRCEYAVRDNIQRIMAEKYLGEQYHPNEWELDKRFSFITGDSAEVGKAWEKKVQYLFIDGDHSYEGVKKDIEAWIPHMDYGGIIGFHDYNHPKGNLMDVSKAVNEFFGDNDSWRIYKANYQMIFFQNWK